MKSKNELLISVLVPVYNTEKYLKECIDSILNQTYSNIEVILVDDGSADDSGAICDKYAEQDARIRVFHKENSGVVDTRRVGVHHATGAYCICVDSDDWLSNDCIERMAEIIEEHEPDIVCCGFIRTDGITHVEVPLYYREGYYTREQLNEKIMPQCLADAKGDSFPSALWAKAYKTHLCREMLTVPETGMTFSEDLCCVAVGLYKCDSLYIMKDCLYYYRNNPESVCSGRKGKPWNIPQLVEQAILRHMDVDAFDYRKQLDRRVFMEMYNVMLFHMERDEPYRIIAKEIRQYLDEPYVQNAIRRCSFSDSKKWMIKKHMLKFRMIWPIFIKLRR